MEELIIDNISDFVGVVTKEDKEYCSDILNQMTFYRGHSDGSWALLPQVFRTDKDFANEHIYLREFQREIPEEASNMDLFDVLVKAQHYGIPTRLLDVSLNPLVALYFACANNDDKDGCVYRFDNEFTYFQEHDLAKLIVHYIFKFKDMVNWNDKMKNGLKKSLQRDGYLGFTGEVDELLVGDQNCIFILPKLSNSRIRFQQGAFILFNTKLKVFPGDKIRFLLPNEEDYSRVKPSKKLIVKKERKKDMLIGLERLGISERTLFPELENQSRCLVRKIKRMSLIN